MVGDIAQLVECCFCMANVSGSNPLISRLKNENNEFCLIQKNKGLWWIPWHSEAMKDVVTCDKLRGAGNKL